MTALARFTIGWIAPLPLELTAARFALDEDFGPLTVDGHTYHGGKIGQHYIVMAVQYAMSTNAASALAERMRIAFKSLQYFLVVGIGGGVPSYGRVDTSNQIVLGDVVVSTGVFQYDFGARTDESQLESREHVKCSLDYLLEAVNTLRAHHRAYKIKISAILQAMLWKIPRDERHSFVDPGAKNDKLFHDQYHHPDHMRDYDCIRCCDQNQFTSRSDRGSKSKRHKDISHIHYDIIDSSNQLQISMTVRNR